MSAGAFAVGKISDEERFDVVRHACPGAGACGGMFTANTMSSALEVSVANAAWCTFFELALRHLACPCPILRARLRCTPVHVSHVFLACSDPDV